MADSWAAGRRESGGVGGEGMKEEKISNNSSKEGKPVQVVDGSDIQQLVEDKQAFGKFIDSKFTQLDLDGDGHLSVNELRPATADIGAALGLPAPGTSPDSDHIYHEVLNEFTDHGKRERVSRREFEKVLCDILLGMAAGLKRDPIVILRMDGQDLEEFVMNSAMFEPEIISIFSEIEHERLPAAAAMIKALQKLTVRHGMPPASDSWVMENVIEPALQVQFAGSGKLLEQPAAAAVASQEELLDGLKKLLMEIARRLKDHPVIVAHSENTFDGGGIKRLLSNKFELEKLLDTVWRELPQDRKHKTSKEYTRVALDRIAASVDLPPYGAVEQVDAVVNEAVKMVDADDGKIVEEAEFKKTLTGVLGSIMLQLQGDSIFFATNTVIHEPPPAAAPASSSSILPPSL